MIGLCQIETLVGSSVVHSKPKGLRTRETWCDSQSKAENWRDQQLLDSQRQTS